MPQNERDDGRILHMWEPLPFQVKAGYNYRRNHPGSRILTLFVRAFADSVMCVYTKVALGVRVEGREYLRTVRNSGVVTVCNHVHPVDCTLVDMVMRGRRMYYLSIPESFKIPGVRHLIRVLGAVPVPKDKSLMPELFSELSSAVRDGAGVQIFPEGVLHPYCPELRKFHTGAFRLAAQAGAPVLPMRIVYRKPDGIYRLYKRKPCLTLVILPPVYPEKNGSPNTLMQLCTEKMEKVKHVS